MTNTLITSVALLLLFSLGCSESSESEVAKESSRFELAVSAGGVVNVPKSSSTTVHVQKRSKIRSRTGQLYLEIDGDRIQSRTGQIQYEIDGKKIRSRTGQTLCELTGDSVRSRTGQVLYEIEGNKIRKKLGQVYCEIDGNRLRGRMGQMRYTIDGVIPKSTIALLIGVGALEFD